ncbi:MAG TPA: HK97 gp10 family phage protein [Phycisphaerae bacterium]|nr:HK97 gp10 family phage protein [Phycisphaerae bacterium]
MRLTIRTKGLEEIRQALNMLPREVAGEHLREVALTGAEVIRAEAKQNALQHKRTGTLAGDIHKEVAQETLGTRVVVRIGPGRKGWYGRLLEYGHDIVRGTRKATRRVIGHVPPYPWLRPALDAKRREAQDVMAQEFRRRLEKVWRRWR